MLDCYLGLGQSYITFIPGRNKTISLIANTLAFNYFNYLLRFLRTRTDLRVSVYWKIKNERNKITSMCITNPLAAGVPVHGRSPGYR